jgi:broad specificity phosphatase PhoE
MSTQPAHVVDLICRAELEPDPQDSTFAKRDDPATLSAAGIEQAQILGRYAVQEGIEPTRFFCSPEASALQMHIYSAEAMDLPPSWPTTDGRLHELNWGDWAGRPHDIYDEWLTQRRIIRLGNDFTPRNGESFKAVYKRMLGFFQALDELLDANTPEHVWAHTHPHTIRAFVGVGLGWSHDRIYNAPVAPASLTRFIKRADKWHLYLFNDVPILR